MADATLFPAGDDELLCSVYQAQGRTLDDLPYTPEFENIYGALVGDAAAVNRAALYHRLHNLRKAGRLPRLGRATAAPLRIAPEHETLLVQLVEGELGRLSLRDQLPYTEPFDRIVQALNTRAGLNLSAHDVWRIVAKLAK